MWMRHVDVYGLTNYSLNIGEFREEWAQFCRRLDYLENPLVNKVSYFVCPVLYSKVVTVCTSYRDVKKLHLLPHRISFDP